MHHRDIFIICGANLQDALKAARQSADEHEQRAKDAAETARREEAKAIDAAAALNLAQQQLAQHTASSQAGLAAANERAQLHAGLAEVIL